MRLGDSIEYGHHQRMVGQEDIEVGVASKKKIGRPRTQRTVPVEEEGGVVMII